MASGRYLFKKRSVDLPSRPKPRMRMRLPRSRFSIWSNRLPMSFRTWDVGWKESMGSPSLKAVIRICSNFSGRKCSWLKRLRIASTDGPSPFDKLRELSGTSFVAARQALTSSTVPTHSKGFTAAVPFSSSKMGRNEASAIRSLPKMAVSFSLERKGDRMIQVKRHLGQWPHHESVLLPTLQLRNTG